MSEITDLTEWNEAILGQEMPNAKRFLITKATSEVIIFHPSDGKAPEGKCPICGADVAILPICDETNRSASPPNSDKEGDQIQKDEKEKQK
jgi:hypothetical protein